MPGRPFERRLYAAGPTSASLSSQTKRLLPEKTTDLTKPSLTSATKWAIALSVFSGVAIAVTVVALVLTEKGDSTNNEPGTVGDNVLLSSTGGDVSSSAPAPSSSAPAVPYITAVQVAGISGLFASARSSTPCILPQCGCAMDALYWPFQPCVKKPGTACPRYWWNSTADQMTCVTPLTRMTVPTGIFGTTLWGVNVSFVESAKVSPPTYLPYSTACYSRASSLYPTSASFTQDGQDFYTVKVMSVISELFCVYDNNTIRSLTTYSSIVNTSTWTQPISRYIPYQLISPDAAQQNLVPIGCVYPWYGDRCQFNGGVDQSSALPSSSLAPMPPSSAIQS
jgi:hypothetical protein